jgi:hypothetical protein
VPYQKRKNSRIRTATAPINIRLTISPGCFFIKVFVMITSLKVKQHVAIPIDEFSALKVPYPKI